MPVSNHDQTMPHHNRKSPRKKDYDYSLSGAYFVTICTHEHQWVLGEIVDGVMNQASLGEIARNCWYATPDHFAHVDVDCFVVMPNHVHAIIVIHKQDKIDDKSPNTNINVGNKHACSLPPTRGIFKNGRYIPPGVTSGSLGAVVGSYKSAVTKIANRTLSDPPSPLWQRFYHDHIIRNEKELNMIRQYVHTNPTRWDEDRFNE